MVRADHKYRSFLGCFHLYLNHSIYQHIGVLQPSRVITLDFAILVLPSISIQNHVASIRRNSAADSSADSLVCQGHRCMVIIK